MQQTSLLAFATLRPTLNRREQSVIRALEKLGVASDREIANYLDFEINMVTGRRNALVKKEKVMEAYRNKAITGRQVIFWKLTNASSEV